MGKSLKIQGKSPVKSPRKRVLTLGRANGARSRPQTAPGGATTTVPSAANIKVVVRVRPPNAREQGDNYRIIIKVVDDQMIIFDPEEESQPFFYHGVQQRGRDLLKKANKNMQFLFDRVFGFDSTNELVFEHSTRSLIDSLMDGYNCSVFVYGATGAGKTHTMLGHDRNPGITFLTMEELFRQKEQLLSERDFELGVSYLEVYNENVQDLLNPGTPLHLREDGKYGVVVAGIQVKRIEEPGELFELLDKGNKNRTQHPTDANAESSRSHAVFQVYLRMNIRATGQMRLAKLSMIDLAGSERGAATGCAGARFTEGANINKSLLALGNCINSLADGQRHIPYRDSKLTRLLKDSLGGNCQTVMIANISPSSMSYEDTYNTLKYATRAKKIKSNVKKNVVSCEMHVGQYVKMVEELNKEVERLKTQLREKDNIKVLCDACGGGAGDGPTPIVAPTVVPTPSTIISINPMKRNELLQLYKERTALQEKIHEIETSEQLLELQRELKIDADTKLSGLCITSSEKEKACKRIGDVANRIQKQVEALKIKIKSLQQTKIDLQKKVVEFVQQNPELKPSAELEDMRLANLESQHKMQELEKVRSFQSDELEKRGQLFETMASVLKPCLLLLKGSGNIPDNLIKEYKQILRQLQGIESVSWHPNIVESQISPANITFTEQDSSGIDGRPRTKRKHTGEEVKTLDSTFTMGNSNVKNTGNICAEQLLTKENTDILDVTVGTPNRRNILNRPQIETTMNKVYEPPAKRIAKIRSASPRVAKENKAFRTIGTMGTSQRFASAPSVANKALLLNHRKPLQKFPTSANKLRT